MKRLSFVIHLHDATNLHFDFRLEVDGVMPSWAIPKGPSLDPTQKRLAMKVPDHDFSYGKFEGEIPEGEYGAGPVIIWDEGTYLPEVEHKDKTREQIKDFDEGNKVMEEGLKKGELKFSLKGKRLKGSFALIKTNFPPGKTNGWLMIKHKDEYVEPGYDAKKFMDSIVSNKKIGNKP